jgi:putative hydrolase of the HAD superfamily
MKVLMLDMDGVIRHIIPEHVERVSKELGYTYSELSEVLWDNEYLGGLITGTISRDDWWCRIQKDNSKLSNVTQESAIWNGIFAINHFDEEVLKLAASVKSQITTGVLTNCDPLSKQRIMKEIEKYQAFDFIFSSSDFGFRKPEPETYISVMNQLQIEPSNIIFFDDHIQNVEGAKDLGINAYLFEDVKQIEDHLKSFLD